ncbi:methyltransferase [Leucobacter sp. CSA1]|uniref:Methyltransferase n=1 Tax=Leucobacter chromiisoli TaxID=2796471 RepID=A0A934Q956_9MICO|nr:methyltransferase [Leucobacter chromiisoli]MBK0419097.1 methyltransferase [Leucobacter chromiisoli]
MDSRLIDLLRADLAEAGYRGPAVTALLGAPADSARQRGVFAPARRVLRERGPSPIASLVRLFLLGEGLPAGELDAALPRLGSAGAATLGLVAAAGAGGAGQRALRAALSLNPVSVERGREGADERADEWWILSDLDDQLRRGPARPDHVMGVGGATRSLLAQAPTRPVASALDLGTGCGVVALHLAGLTSGRVVATDISERALALARANARLNGLEERIEFRRGDLFGPVAGERFDLILSNPPFVITPRGDADAPVYEYRDGGRTGDELAAAVVRSAPEHLAEGGVLLCLANWESPWGSDGFERVRGWIADADAVAGPLAAWVVERDRVDPARYAETWARDGGARPGEAEFERLVEAWIDDFSARRVSAVGLGSIRVERLEPGSEAPPIRLERAGGAFDVAPGRALQRAFDVAIAWAGRSDGELLATRWLLDPAVEEERRHRPGEEAPSDIALTSARGIARRVAADPLLAAAVGACDGELTLGQIADALATLLEVDGEAAAEALCDGVRELVWLGMLAPAA